MIECYAKELTVEKAKRLGQAVKEQLSSMPHEDLMLNLSRVSLLSVEAAQMLVEICNESHVATSGEYPISFTYFGMTELSPELAEILAQLPSHFLCFDNVTELPVEVARQFLGYPHALTFPNCTEISSAALRALAQSANLLDISLSSLSLEQAHALSDFKFDLSLKAEYLSPEVLYALGPLPNLNPRLVEIGHGEFFPEDMGDSNFVIIQGDKHEKFH